MKFEFSRQIFEKVLNIEFHQNPSIGSRVVPCGQMDVSKLIVTFRNFAKRLMNGLIPSTALLRRYGLYVGNVPLSKDFVTEVNWP
jgi:hypothetical protein